MLLNKSPEIISSADPASSQDCSYLHAGFEEPRDVMLALLGLLRAGGPGSPAGSIFVTSILQSSVWVFACGVSDVLLIPSCGASLVSNRKVALIERAGLYGYPVLLKGTRVPLGVRLRLLAGRFPGTPFCSGSLGGGAPFLRMCLALSALWTTLSSLMGMEAAPELYPDSAMESLNAPAIWIGGMFSDCIVDGTPDCDGADVDRKSCPSKPAAAQAALMSSLTDLMEGLADEARAELSPGSDWTRARTCLVAVGGVSTALAELRTEAWADASQVSGF